MKIATRLLTLSSVLWLGIGVAHAGKYEDTIELFKHAGESAVFFKDCYAYDRVVGDTTMTQLSLGFQAGGQAYSQIIFFQAKRDLDEFESGKFEFSAGASAVAITASASVSVGTDRASSQAGSSATSATTNGDYQTGMAVFTVAKGGLMYAAAIAGQKFTFNARGTD
jgi:hypothetical protein